jgi:hypothetical protein
MVCQAGDVVKWFVGDVGWVEGGGVPGVVGQQTHSWIA